MKSKSNLYKFCKIVIYVMVICILLTVSLHKTSTALKALAFHETQRRVECCDNNQT